jgi:transposase-like protein
MENYSVRQLCELSGHSRAKLSRIKDYWLARPPEEVFDYSRSKYLIFDGTYFHKDGCLISLMDAESQKTISALYEKREGYESVYPWFRRLKELKLQPLAITMDGERSVMRAIRQVWPETQIQRCLYHIQREGMRWLRSSPKTLAGQELRRLLGTLCRINNQRERDEFIISYALWLEKHAGFVLSLSRKEVASKDLRKAMALIYNGLDDMFHFLADRNIPKTTNTLESFYSRLKSDYRRHRGLTEKHKIGYLRWYCYFKNHKSSNTF